MPNETKSPPQGPNGIEPRALIPSGHAPNFKPEMRLNYGFLIKIRKMFYYENVVN